VTSGQIPPLLSPRPPSGRSLSSHSLSSPNSFSTPFLPPLAPIYKSRDALALRIFHCHLGSSLHLRFPLFTLSLIFFFIPFLCVSPSRITQFSQDVQPGMDGPTSSRFESPTPLLCFLEPCVNRHLLVFSFDGVLLSGIRRSDFFSGFSQSFSFRVPSVALCHHRRHESEEVFHLSSFFFPHDYFPPVIPLQLPWLNPKEPCQS